jgi:hypothetical protein
LAASFLCLPPQEYLPLPVCIPISQTFHRAPDRGERDSYTASLEWENISIEVAAEFKHKMVFFLFLSCYIL